MQSFDLVSTKATLRDSRALLVNNDRTVMSNNSGTKFPTINTELGMFCYRTDQKKLYILEDKTNSVWNLVFDASKTAVDKEYVDAQVATRSASSHNHDTTYYTKSLSDARYYLKTESDAKFLGKAETAADSSKFDGNDSSAYVRSNIETTMSANLRFGDSKELRLGAAADVRMFFNGTNFYHRNARAGSSNYFELTKADGSLSRCMLFSGGTNASVILYYNGASRLETESAGVRVTGQLYATGAVVSASDERLKTNIATINDAISRISSCRGVEFDMNGHRYYGLIAQEVEKTLPHAVVQLNDEMKTKSVNYASLVGVLFEAIKELSFRLGNVESRLENK